MSEPGLLQFEDSVGAVRYNLSTLWTVLQTFDLGDEPVDYSVLSQAPHGAIQVAATPGIAETFIPLTLTSPTTWSAVKTAYAAIVAELKRETNILRFRPPGQSDVYLLDTFRSAVPTIFRGGDAGPAPSVSLHVYLDLVIRRSPELRGAASYI